MQALTPAPYQHFVKPTLILPLPLLAALVGQGLGVTYYCLLAWLCNRAFAVERHIQRETIIRIRIRSTIIRIRTTDTRILRIIRISSRKQLVHPKHRNLYCVWAGALRGAALFECWQGDAPCTPSHILLLTGIAWLSRPKCHRWKCQGTKGNQNAHAHTLHDKTHPHNGHPHTPHDSQQQQKAAGTSHRQ